jgi:hypothetical protein
LALSEAKPNARSRGACDRLTLAAARQMTQTETGLLKHEK